MQTIMNNIPTKNARVILDGFYKSGSVTHDVIALVKTCPDHLFPQEFDLLIETAKKDKRYDVSSDHVPYVLANQWHIGKNTPLVEAVLFNKEQAVKTLIKFGARVNENTNAYDRGLFALAAALTHPNIEIIKTLLAAQANPNAANSVQAHVLMHALDDQEKFNLMMSYGASMDIFKQRHPRALSSVMQTMESMFERWIDESDRMVITPPRKRVIFKTLP